jgi:hypothetical protein
MATILKPFPFSGADFSKGIATLPDPIKTPQGYIADGRNVRFYRGVINKRPGMTSAGTLTGTIQRIIEYVDLRGNWHWLAISTTGIWSQDSPSGGWTQRATLAGNVNWIPSFTEFQGQAVVSNDVDPIQVWDGTATSFTAITGTGAPDHARYVLGYQNHLLVGYPTLAGVVYPYRIMWADFNSWTNWTTGDAAIVDLLDFGDPIMGLNTVAEFGVLGRRYSIWLVLGAPSPAFYQFSKRQDQAGVIAPGSFSIEQISELGLPYLSDNDIFLVNGISAQGVGTPIRNLIAMNGINWNQLSTAVATVHQPFGEYWLAFAADKASTANDTIAVWNWKDQTFSLDDTKATALGRRQQMWQPRWSDFPIAWFDPSVKNIVRWNAASAPDAPQVAIGQGAVIQQVTTPPNDNGSAFTSYVTTQLWDLGQPGRKRVERVQLSQDVETSQGPISAYLITSESSDYYTAASWGPYSLSLGNEQELWFDTDGVDSAKYFAVHLEHAQPCAWNLRDITLWARGRGMMG